jgi:naphthalene 1,2-dioxygenase ferredoxin component
MSLWSPKSWVDAAAVADLTDVDRLAWYGPDGEEILILKINGDLHAVSNVCTHARALMIGGEVDGYELECPLHGARFDVRDGHVVAPPATKALKVYPVKAEQGRIWIKV